jgi:hypothetical protein
MAMQPDPAATLARNLAEAALQVVISHLRACPSTFRTYFVLVVAETMVDLSCVPPDELDSDAGVGRIVREALRQRSAAWGQPPRSPAPPPVTSKPDKGAP